LSPIFQATHVGKVVVSAPRPYHAGADVHGIQGGVLITGGLGSLGILTARWLVGQGATRLHLVSWAAGVLLMGSKFVACGRWVTARHSCNGAPNLTVLCYGRTYT
jgi:hypothetical protein